MPLSIGNVLADAYFIRERAQLIRATITSRVYLTRIMLNTSRYVYATEHLHGKSVLFNKTALRETISPRGRRGCVSANVSLLAESNIFVPLNIVTSGVHAAQI